MNYTISDVGYVISDMYEYWFIYYRNPKSHIRNRENTEGVNSLSKCRLVFYQSAHLRKHRHLHAVN